MSGADTPSRRGRRTDALGFYVDPFDVPLGMPRETRPKRTQPRNRLAKSTIPFPASKENVAPTPAQISGPMRLGSVKVRKDSITIAKRKQEGAKSSVGAIFSSPLTKSLRILTEANTQEGKKAKRHAHRTRVTLEDKENVNHELKAAAPWKRVFRVMNVDAPTHIHNPQQELRARHEFLI